MLSKLKGIFRAKAVIIAATKFRDNIGMTRNLEFPICEMANGKYIVTDLKANILVTGTQETGKTLQISQSLYNLKPCICECKEPPLLIYDKLSDCYDLNGSVMAACHVCGRHTKKMELTKVIDAWNCDVITKGKQTN